MAVQTDQFQGTPYTSTVPLVQIPPDVIGGQTRPAQPLQGEFGKKGTGAMAIGDSLLKGFMLGHQQKEQKKAEQAKATINAADAAAEASYQQYQEALTKAGGKQDDPAAKAAYDAYTTAFQAGKQAKAQFVIPDKQKDKKADSAKGPDGKKKPASAGFNNIKDFFEANPHIVPQIALVTMQPKPPGLAPQAQEQVQNLESQKLSNQKQAQQQQNEQTYQTGFPLYSHLGPDEIAALPPDAKKGYDAWQGARAALTPMKFSGSPQKYKLPNGKIVPLYKEEAEQNYPGAELYIPGQEPKPGTPGFYLSKKAQELGKSVNDLSTEEINAAMAEQKAALIPQTDTVSTSTTDVKGNRTTDTKRVAKPGGITKPPTASAAPRAQGVPSTAPQGSTQFTVGAKPQGMVEEGNLPIWNRPTVQNAGGSHSSEYSTSFEQDGKEVLVPTVVNGKFLTPDGKKPKEGSPEEKAMFKAAWQNYLKTGDNLGKFANSKDADAYAQTLHSRGAAKQGISKPPQAGKTAQGGIAPPPRSKETALTASVTRQAVTKQQEGYKKAETAHAKALADAEKALAKAQVDSVKNNDPSILAEAQKARDRAVTRAELDLEEAKAGVAKEYDAAVKSIGGRPGNEASGNLPPGWQ
jgi:hypothetical protein